MTQKSGQFTLGVKGGQNGLVITEIQSAPHGVAMSTTTYIPTVQTQPVLKVVGGL